MCGAEYHSKSNKLKDGALIKAFLFVPKGAISILITQTEDQDDTHSWAIFAVVYR